MAVSGQVWKRAADKNNQAEKQGQMRYFQTRPVQIGIPFRDTFV
jgi:hypothetical protein